jgi:hypothetical protein
MATAKTSPVPDYCPACARDTPTSIDLNKGGQFVGTCAYCKVPKGTGAIPVVFSGPKGGAVITSRPIAGTGSKVGGDQDERELPAMVRPEQVAQVLPFPQRPNAPGSRLDPLDLSAPAAVTSADDIVAISRLQLARLDAQIPDLEAQLAAAKAHRKGLAKMIAAYDGVPKPPARRRAEPAIADPGPPPSAARPTDAVTSAPIHEPVITEAAPAPSKPARKRANGRFARTAAQ